jgi:hypothetical protein
MPQTRNAREHEEAQRRRELQDFFQHLIVFIVVNLVLFTIDLISSPGDFWFYWVTLFWGIGIAIQAFGVLALDRRLADRVMDGSRRSVAREPKRPVSRPHATSNGAELREITERAEALIDRMRASARRIPDTEARREALSACAASDQVLAAIVDHPDEITIARDFLHRFLEPASTVIGDYTRLATRNVPSARETLRQVETHDLPLLTRRANEIYDRLHRGTLIDLEVAREMLTLDMADTSLPDGATNA